MIGPGTAIFSCPTTTPTNSTLVTVPRLNLPMRSLPSQNPRKIVRKIANSGRSLSWLKIHSIIKNLGHSYVFCKLLSLYNGF